MSFWAELSFEGKLQRAVFFVVVPCPDDETVHFRTRPVESTQTLLSEKSTIVEITQENSRSHLSFPLSPYRAGATYFQPAIPRASRRTAPLELNLDLPNARSSWDSKGPVPYVASRSPSNQSSLPLRLSKVWSYEGSLDTQNSSDDESLTHLGRQNPFISLRESPFEHFPRSARSDNASFPSDHSSFQPQLTRPYASSSRSASIGEFATVTAQPVSILQTRASLTTLSFHHQRLESVERPDPTLVSTGILTGGEGHNPFDDPTSSPLSLERINSRDSGGEQRKLKRVDELSSATNLTRGATVVSSQGTQGEMGAVEGSEGGWRGTIATSGGVSSAASPFHFDNAL